MSNLLDLLQGQLDENLIDQLSSKIGADPVQTAAASKGILSTLVGALARNAASPEGAGNLANALDRDHDGGLLDNLAGFFGGGSNVKTPSARTTNGGGILDHILGNRQSGATDMISQMSGLNQNQTGNLMSMLAPIVMGMLGKQKQEKGLDSGGLAGMLANAVNHQQDSGNPLMNLATRFLDKDGDGSMMDDVMGMVGGMFSRK